MSKILALDTATDACSAALLLDDNSIDARYILAPSAHTKYILNMINDLLVKAGLSYGQLDAVAFGCGPGSFTGVRLATSLTQGLSFAAGCSVIGVSSLRALAQEVFEEFKSPKVLVAQDARMQELYWGEYQVDQAGIMQPIVPDQLIKSGAVNFESYYGWVGGGNGFSFYEKNLLMSYKIKICPKQYSQAKYIAILAAADFIKGIAVRPEQALPIYLREKVTHSA